jgi:hypothetical protein
MSGSRSWLDVEEYYETIEQVSALAITGGALYDALIACCALKAKADMISTWNVKHFQQLGQEIRSALIHSAVPVAGFHFIQLSNLGDIFATLRIPLGDSMA